MPAVSAFKPVRAADRVAHIAKLAAKQSAQPSTRPEHVSVALSTAPHADAWPAWRKDLMRLLGRRYPYPAWMVAFATVNDFDGLFARLLAEKRAAADTVIIDEASRHQSVIADAAPEADMISTDASVEAVSDHTDAAYVGSSSADGADSREITGSGLEDSKQSLLDRNDIDGVIQAYVDHSTSAVASFAVLLALRRNGVSTLVPKYLNRLLHFVQDLPNASGDAYKLLELALKDLGCKPSYVTKQLVLHAAVKMKDERYLLNCYKLFRSHGIVISEADYARAIGCFGDSGNIMPCDRVLRPYRAQLRVRCHRISFCY